MAYETDPCQASDWTELLNVVFDFLRQSLPHLQDVALSLLLVALAAQKNAIRMQNG